MRLPHVREALHERREAELQGDMAQLALGTMRDLLRDETPAATRYQAAKWVLKQAGHDAEDEQRHGQPKSLEDMNADELAQAVHSGMTALQELAGQLTGTHYIDGQLQPIQDIEQEAESADFLD